MSSNHTRTCATSCSGRLVARPLGSHERAIVSKVKHEPSSTITQLHALPAPAAQFSDSYLPPSVFVRNAIAAAA